MCYRNRYSLLVHVTSLTSLGLESLQSVENGDVGVVDNVQLCYTEAIPWSEILQSADQTHLVDSNMAYNDCGESFTFSPTIFSEPKTHRCHHLLVS